jgi:hypothetical protein
MIPEILVGQGVLHGIQNDGTPLGIGPTYGTFVLNKITGSHVWDLKTLKDETDFTTAMAAVDEGAEIEIDWTVSSGAGGTRAAAAATAVFPAPLQAFTLTGNKLQGAFQTSVGKLFDGLFCYLGGAKIDESQNDFVKLTGLKLKKWANPTQNASLTTTVVG